MNSPIDSLFTGDLLVRPVGHALAEEAKRVVDDIFGDSPETLDNQAFKSCLQQSRELLAGPEFRLRALELLSHVDITFEGLRVDRLRLRAVSPGLENIEAAAPVFYAHRDTWYGNPKCQINVWVPLHDVNEKNSFRFYLEHFHSEIANDSEQFDADRFRGFGRLESAVDWCYPRALVNPTGEVYDVRMNRGEALLFSAAHLHQTLPNRSPKVRFSVDFRFFLQQHLEEDLGAPDPDNRSRGLMLEDYSKCGS